MAAPNNPNAPASEVDLYLETMRQNPRSMVFAPLAEAYIKAGKLQEAVDVCQRGLLSHPEFIEGRLALGKALLAQKRLKEAQVELLKVVKLDRQNRQGYKLLAEVLVGRSDFERAGAILQHARQLDPSDAQIIDLQKRVETELAKLGRPAAPPPEKGPADAEPTRVDPQGS